MRIGLLCSRSFLVAGSIALFSCGEAPDAGLDLDAYTTANSEALTEYVPNQTKANTFYAYDNIVDITVHLSDSVWTTIKTESPAGGTCTRQAVDSNGESPSRYPWRTAGQVIITDSKNTTNVTFASGVDIKKKSYCGSLTTGENDQPSLKLRIASSSAVSAIGTQYIDLNNSIQDSSYIRQTLGYYLFGLAGLPHPRVNYARVHVITETKTQDYVYVNVEPIRGSFIGNPDNGFTNRTITQSGSTDAKAPGDLYELELGDDFDSASLTYVGLETISKVQASSRPDFAYAGQSIAAGTVAGLQNVVNVDQFATFWAMEVLLKHWDGYTQGRNNTYIYNDVAATSGTQSASTVDFKFIPWGIDQILQPSRRFTISENSKAGKIARNDTTLYNKFVGAVQTLRGNIFSRAMLDGTLKTRIDELSNQLLSLGIDSTAEINKIRVQLKLARAAAILISGSNSSSFYLADVNTGDVIHASNTEQKGIYYEVYHRQPQDDASDRWILSSSLISEAYGRALYATANLVTSAGHYYIFTEPNGNYPAGEAWSQYYDVTTYSNGGLKDFSGTFTLRSGRTSRYAHFSSTDLTPLGRPRVYQGQTDGSDASNIFIY